MEEERGYHIATPEEGVAFFDREARRVTGLSGEEFLRRFDAGEVVADDNTRAGREIGYLILLIPFARRVPA